MVIAMTKPVVRWREHECLNCGHKQSISTNHVMGCIDYCKNCSWKPSFGKKENAIPFGTHTYRPFKCLEEN